MSHQVTVIISHDDWLKVVKLIHYRYMDVESTNILLIENHICCI